MAKPRDSWRVLAHGSIEHLAENLWRVEGELEDMQLKRVMTLAKRSDGKLVVHNGIALGESEMSAIEAWGEPAYLVVPNGYHRMDAAAFKKRYPNITVVCPAGARKKVEEVVAVDATYADYPSDEAVELRTIDGIGEQEGVMRVRSDDGVTLVLNDVVFNTPHGKGVTGFIFRYLTQSTGGPRVSRIFRWFVMKDREALRAALKELATTPDLRRIVVSHHRTITEDPSGTLQRVAEAL